MTLTNQEVAVLRIGTRGKGNAEKLLGNEFSGIRITDSYSSFKQKTSLLTSQKQILSSKTNQPSKTAKNLQTISIHLY